MQKMKGMSSKQMASREIADALVALRRAGKRLGQSTKLDRAILEIEELLNEGSGTEHEAAAGHLA